MSEYVHAALLLHSADQKINQTNLKKVLSAAGIKADDVRIKALVASLDGVDIEEAIKSAATAPSVTVAAPSEAAKEAAKEEGKKEAAKEEGKKEEEAIQGLGALFGA